MEKFIIKSINKEVTKRNFFQCLNELKTQFNNRRNLNIYQLSNLKRDFITMQQFMFANVKKHNFKTYQYYTKRCKKAYNTIIDLIFINI